MHSWKMPDSGRPEEASDGGTEGAGSRGNLGACCKGPLKDGRREETRRTIAGTVGRRGDGETRSLNRRPEGLMRGSGSWGYTVIERPETKVSGLFVFDGNFPRGPISCALRRQRPRERIPERRRRGGCARRPENPRSSAASLYLMGICSRTAIY